MIRSGPLPEETFRIRPFVGRREYFLVHVAASLDALNRATRAFAHYRHDVQACVVSTMCRGRRAGLLGVVFVARDAFDAPLVAHELAHAAFRAVERDGVRVDHWVSTERSRTVRGALPATSAEERYCAVLARLTAGFWRAVRARRLR